MLSVLWPASPDLVTSKAMGAATERTTKGEPRCEAWSYGYFPCFGKARYVVSATMPGETEPPTLCWTHAKVQVSTAAVPHGVLYHRAPQGQGWVVVTVSQSMPSPPAGQQAPRHARQR